jgi:hypothetical protein
MIQILCGSQPNLPGAAKCLQPALSTRHRAEQGFRRFFHGEMDGSSSQNGKVAVHLQAFVIQL